jgi:CRISPR/Cas system-associated exonuclease Cas4 (RecB family)
VIASGDMFDGLISPSVFVLKQVHRLFPDLALRENDVVDVVLGLIRHAEHHETLGIGDWLRLLDSSPYAPVLPVFGSVDAVTITTLENIDDALYGIVDPVVLIVGCVEGELPSRPSRGSFETYVLGGLPEPTNRLGGHLANERWSVERVAVVASSIMLFAAPDPGVLVSRFAEGLTRQQPTWPTRVLDRNRWDASLSTTTNETPLVPEQRLTLSATQLTMFENCPWQYTVQYRLRVRSEGGVAARFGSYVHDVLETFLAPLARIPALHGADQHPTEQDGFDSHEVAFAFTHTFEGLLALAKHKWTDDIIDHPSQGDDFRRRALDQFTGWWEREGQRLVTSNEVAFVEYPFDIAIGQHRLKGFIDRIDQTARNGVAIIDYKTGAAKTQAQVGDDLQLAVYHLAAVSDPDLIAIGPVESLTLNYLKDSRSVSQPIVEGHELVTHARIQTLIDEILDESHEPSTHANCDYCDLHRVCDLQLAGRPVPIAFNRRSANIKANS